MALSNYQRNDLQNQIADTTVSPNITSQVTIQNILNRTARMVFTDVDLRSSIRVTGIGGGTDIVIMDNVFLYPLPTDLKDDAIIDVRPKGERSLNSRVRLVTPEQFTRKTSTRNLQLAVLNSDNTRRLMLDIDVTDTEREISSFDTLNAGGGTWVVLNDATNIVKDVTNFKEGSASLKFDLTGSDTTAGLQNTAIDSFDLTDYLNTGYLLCWFYINSTTNLTSLAIRIGSDSSNYYTITVNSSATGNSFINGWNSIKWDLLNKTTTGTPVDTAIDYIAIFMNKTSGKSDDGYRIDDLTLHLGETYEVEYYSKFPWQRDNGTYAENSAGGTDYINADLSELDILTMRGKAELYRELRDYDQMNLALAEYKDMITKYKRANPSRRLLYEDSYYRF